MNLNSIKSDKLRKSLITKALKRGFDTPQWSYFEDSEELMDRLVWTPIKPNIKRADPMAFATRSSGLTGVYERYVNPAIDEMDPTGSVGNAFRMHENGHCIFTHMSLQKEQREIQINKILTFWPKIKKHVDLSKALKKAEEKGISEDKVAKKYAKMLANQMLNIAMDFEVNSKLFTDDEWTSMKKNTDIAYFYCSAKAPATSDEAIEKMIEWLDTNEDKPDERFSHPCWPADYDFPPKLTYGEYIDLMLQNIDKFMSDMANQQGSGGESEDEDEDGEESDGQGGNGDGDGEDGDEEGDNGKGKLTAEDIERMRSEYGDGDNDENQERVEDAENGGDGNTNEQNEEQGKAPNKSKSTGGKNGKAGKAEQAARTAGMASKRSGGHGFSPVGSAEDPTEYCEGADNPKVEAYIMKNIFNKKILNNRVDMMKYYNRKKYGNVMVSTWAQENVWRPGDIHMIVDCSGSIDNAAITTFIKCVKKVAKKCGPKSRIIWWDTHLQGDTYLRNNKGPKGCGGTDIASGIAYLREHHLKNKNDKVIIISDYEDSLYRWYEEISKLKNECVGICWTYNKVENKYDYLNRYSYGTESDMMVKLMKKLPTLFVNINE